MIALVPNPTGTGHNMRMFAIAKEIKKQAEEEVIVFLASLQHIFLPMFEEIGVKVVDLNPGSIVDYSKKSHLATDLNWNTMIENYFVPTFYNGNLILKYMNIFIQYKPSVVVSDYNINATIAAGNLSIINVFVTERHNFTLVDVPNENLIKGGFEIVAGELDQARLSLNHLFASMCDKVDLILTDKPYVAEMDQGSLIEKYLREEKAYFVGPMIRPVPPKGGDIRKELGLDDGPLIVATVSGTTMFSENKQSLLDAFIQVFVNLKTKYSNLQMVLLGRGETDVPEGIRSIPYLPNWIPLLQEASVLLAHPGWITVTEIASLGVPTIFCLASYKEYHETEAFERLEKLGFSTHYGSEAAKLSQKVDNLLADEKNVSKLLGNYKNIAYDNLGVTRAAQHILRLHGQAKETAIAFYS